MRGRIEASGRLAGGERDGIGEGRPSEQVAKEKEEPGTEAAQGTTLSSLTYLQGIIPEGKSDDAPVGMPSSLLPLPKPFWTAPRRKRG